MGGRRANLLTAALNAEIWTAACSYRGTVARCRAAAAGSPLSLPAVYSAGAQDYLTTSLLQVFALEYIHLRRLLRLSGDSLDIGDSFDRATESSDAGAGQSAGTGRKVQSFQQKNTQNCKFIALYTNVQHADSSVWDKRHLSHIHLLKKFLPVDLGTTTKLLFLSQNAGTIKYSYKKIYILFERSNM